MVFFGTVGLMVGTISSIITFLLYRENRKLKIEKKEYEERLKKLSGKILDLRKKFPEVFH